MGLDKGNKPETPNETAEEYRARNTVTHSTWDVGLHERAAEIKRMAGIKEATPRGYLLVIGMAATQDKYRQLRNSNR